MADKFCDPTLSTGLNDGTSVANAWQNLDTIMTGTLPGGSINAGDVIHIRSDDGAGADNNVSVGGTITRLGTAAAPVEWRVDDGTYWSNPAKLTIEVNLVSGGFLTMSAYTILNGQDKANFNIQYVENTGALRLGWLSFGEGGTIRNATIDALHPGTGQKTIGYGQSNASYENRAGLFENCTIGPLYSSSATSTQLVATSGQRFTPTPLVFKDCVIDLNSAVLTDVFKTKSTQLGGPMQLENCTFTNVVAGAALGTESLIEMRRCKVGLLNLGPSATAASTIRTGRVIAHDIGCVAHDFALDTYEGAVEWRRGQNYPVLNAILPDSANTGWSWRVFPNINVTEFGEAGALVLPRVNKYYNAASATVTFSIEILLNNSFGTPNDDEIWFEVQYIDNTNTARTQSSKGTGSALATSTAGWSATVYGANSYNKFKMEIASSHTLLTETLVEATTFMAIRGSASTDFMFFDPELGIV